MPPFTYPFFQIDHPSKEGGLFILSDFLQNIIVFCAFMPQIIWIFQLFMLYLICKLRGDVSH